MFTVSELLMFEFYFCLLKGVYCQLLVNKQLAKMMFVYLVSGVNIQTNQLILGLESNMANIHSHSLALLMTLFVAGSFLSVAELSGTVHPVALTLFRFIGAVVVFSPIVLGVSKHRSAIKQVLPKSFVISFFYSIFFICMFKSLETTTATNTSALYTLVPFITAILCFFLIRQKISGPMLSAYIMGSVGATWVIFRGNIDAFFNLHLNTGDLYFLVGCISMACFSIAMKVLYKGESMSAMVFCTLVGGIVWMAMALLYLGHPIEMRNISNIDYLHILYLAVFATLFTTLILQKITVQLGPTRVMAYVYMTPVLVLLLEFLLKGQSLNSVMFPGIVLSIMATFYIQKIGKNEVKTN